MQPVFRNRSPRLVVASVLLVVVGIAWLAVGGFAYLLTTSLGAFTPGPLQEGLLLLGGVAFVVLHLLAGILIRRTSMVGRTLGIVVSVLGAVLGVWASIIQSYSPVILLLLIPYTFIAFLILSQGTES
jgi:hypothetical protein